VFPRRRAVDASDRILNRILDLTGSRGHRLELPRFSSTFSPPRARIYSAMARQRQASSRGPQPRVRSRDCKTECDVPRLGE